MTQVKNSAAPYEIRSKQGTFTARADDGGKKFIEGYFATFEGSYELWPGAVERIDRHAFDDVLGQDVRALDNHDPQFVLGRTAAGTLTLRVDDHGLWGSIEINEQDTDALNAWARVQRGDVSQCSFGFNIGDEQRSQNSDGSVTYTIKKVSKLWEVSICTFPAYEETDVSARNNAGTKSQTAALWADNLIKKLKGAKKDA